MRTTMPQTAACDGCRTCSVHSVGARLQERTLSHRLLCTVQPRERRSRRPSDAAMEHCTYGLPPRIQSDAFAPPSAECNGGAQSHHAAYWLNCLAAGKRALAGLGPSCRLSRDVLVDRRSSPVMHQVESIRQQRGPERARQDPGCCWSLQRFGGTTQHPADGGRGPTRTNDRRSGAALSACSRLRDPCMRVIIGVGLDVHWGAVYQYRALDASQLHRIPLPVTPHLSHSIEIHNTVVIILFNSEIGPGPPADSSQL